MLRLVTALLDSVRVTGLFSSISRSTCAKRLHCSRLFSTLALTQVGRGLRETRAGNEAEFSTLSARNTKAVGSRTLL